MEFEMNCAYRPTDCIKVDTEANSKGLYISVRQGLYNSAMVLSKEDQKKLFLLLADELDIEYVEPLKMAGGGLAKGFEATYLDGYEEFRNSITRITETFPQAETVESLSKRFDRLEEDLAKFNEKAFDNLTDVENDLYKALNPLTDHVRVLEANSKPPKINLEMDGKILAGILSNPEMLNTLERLGND